MDTITIWNTIGTILATGIVICGGYFLNDFLQGKREAGKQKLERERETRAARRKDRERVVAPIREALVELHASLQGRSLWENIKGTFKDIPDDEKKSLDLSKIEEFEPLREYVSRSEATDSIKILVRVMPLVFAITKQDTREIIQKVFLPAALSKALREKLGITDKYIEDNINSAYQVLEDYVAAAD